MNMPEKRESNNQNYMTHDQWAKGCNDSKTFESMAVLQQNNECYG